MSLRLKLLLLGLATLVLPWGGCRYAREMESALREGEANSLQAVSQTIAASLQGRTDLLYRAPPPPAEAADEPQPDSGAQQATAQAFDKPGPDDLEPLALTAAPLLDGYGDDWPHQPGAWTNFRKDEHHHFAVLSGVYERMLYVLLEVHDEHPLYDAPGTNTLDAATFGDRVWLGFDDAQGEQHQVFISATGPGSVSARRIESGEYGQRSAPVEPRIRGAWQPTPRRLPHRAARAAVHDRPQLRHPGRRPRRARRGAGQLRHAAQRRPAHPRASDRRLARAQPVPDAVPAAGPEARGQLARRAGAGACRCADAAADTRPRDPGPGEPLPALRRPAGRAAAARVDRARSTTAITPP